MANEELAHWLYFFKANVDKYRAVLVKVGLIWILLNKKIR